MPAEPSDAHLRAAAYERTGDEGRSLLGAIVVLGVRRRVTAEAIADALEAPGVLAALGLFPHVEVGPDRIAVGDQWTFAPEFLDATELEVATGAAVESAARSGDLSEAGRIAAAGRSASALRSVLRAALRVHPPKVSAHDLRSWRDAGVLEADDPHEWWLDATCRALLYGPSPEVFTRYEQARIVFAERADQDAEIAVGMAAAIIARRLDDAAALVAFIVRANELAAAGCVPAAGSARLGRALVHQMGGDPASALAELEAVLPGSFEGDWAAQLSMMRGTNLMLMGRLDEGLAHLTAATGTGSNWSYAIALELSASARWHLDDRVGAIHDLEVAEEVALSVGATVDADRMRSQRAAMLASEGDPEVGALLLEALAGADRDEESERILRTAQVLVAVGDGELDHARELAAQLAVPARAARSAHWTVPVQSALAPHTADQWLPVIDAHATLREAFDAGASARSHLAGGPLAPRSARPYLPAVWCEPVEPVVELRLLGGAAVLRNRGVVREPAWERGRVRELCCYLALVEDSSRDLASERLWPDLSAAAASKNLRVTLTYLLDVLDPNRGRGTGSDLVTEQDGTIRLARTDRLRIDLRDLLARSRAVLRSAQAGDDHTLVREARLLVRLPRGAVLGGASLGAWFEPYDESRRELVLRAVSAAGPVVLRAGDADLAEALARRGLEEDPWAERLHQLVVRACLARDDLDAARRALRLSLSVINDLDVRPERATLDLAREVGLEIPA